MSKHDPKVVLEGMVDAMGLGKVLDLLADICVDKANHVQTNWQDKITAATWTQAGRQARYASLARSVMLVSNKEYDPMASTQGPHPAMRQRRKESTK